MLNLHLIQHKSLSKSETGCLQLCKIINSLVPWAPFSKVMLVLCFHARLKPHSSFEHVSVYQILTRLILHLKTRHTCTIFADHIHCAKEISILKNRITGTLILKEASMHFSKKKNSHNLYDRLIIVFV